MLVLVEDNREKSNAQQAMEASVTGHLQRNGSAKWASRAGMWTRSCIPTATARCGRRSRTPAQQISVELNIPTTSNSASDAGFFAREPFTGATYLMRHGSVGEMAPEEDSKSMHNFLI